MVLFAAAPPASLGTLLGIIVLGLIILGFFLVRRYMPAHTVPVPAGTPVPGSLSVPSSGEWGLWFGIVLVLLAGLIAVPLWFSSSLFLKTQKVMGGGDDEVVAVTAITIDETETTVKWAEKRKDKVGGGYLIVSLGKAKYITIARDAMGTDSMQCEASGEFNVKDNWGDIPARLVIIVYAKNGKMITRDVPAVMTPK